MNQAIMERDAGRSITETAEALLLTLDGNEMLDLLRMLRFNLKGRWPVDAELKMSMAARMDAVASLIGELPPAASKAFLAHIAARRGMCRVEWEEVNPTLAEMVNKDKPARAPAVTGDPIADEEGSEDAVKWVVEGWRICLDPHFGMIWDRGDRGWYTLTFDGQKEHARDDCRNKEGDLMVLPGWN